MHTDVDVIVIGGGLAGASTARELAKRGIGVTLLERKRTSGEKVCGEFLSHDGVASLRRQGVEDAVSARGAVPIRHVMVTAQDTSWSAVLPDAGIGLSRAQLDATLLDAATVAGVRVERDAHARSVERFPDYAAVRVEQGGHTIELRARCVVGAVGRRATVGPTERPHSATDGVGFKGHFTGLDLAGRVELHAFRGGYCGLAPIERSRTNVCLQVQASVLRAHGGTYETLRERVLMREPLLAERLALLHPEQDQMLAVAGLRSRRRRARSGEMVMVGDAGATITPLCGDGMAMALRAGELLPPRVEQYLHGEISWERLLAVFDAEVRREFSRRLVMGRIIEAVLIRPRLAARCLRFLDSAPKLGTTLIRSTRGNA